MTLDLILDMTPETMCMTAQSANSLALETGILFSLPAVVEQLHSVLNSPYATHAEIGEVIIHDPALTARALERAHAQQGVEPRSIDTVSGALAVLRRDALQALAAETPVTQRFGGIAADRVDMNRFWMNSMACGIAARSLAFRCRVFHTEPFFVAGFLHKIGRLAFYSSCPEQYSEVLNRTEPDEDALNREEFRVFGFNHARLGAELLRRYKVPERLCMTIAHYLAPGQARRFRRSAALVHVASALAAEIEPSVNLDGDGYHAGLGFEKGAWELLGLPLTELEPVLKETFAETIRVFDQLLPSRP